LTTEVVPDFKYIVSLEKGAGHPELFWKRGFAQNPSPY
jgi:hypothetical protein